MSEIEFPNVQRLINKPAQLQPQHMMKLWRHNPEIFVKDIFDLSLDVWQQDAFELYMNYQRIAMVANKGPGKLEPCNTMIYTPKGLTRFGDLKPGDMVFSEYGTPTEVTAIHPQGIKDIYRVTFDDGSFADCGLEHLWKVRGVQEKLKGTWAVMSTEQIMAKGVKKKQGEQDYYPWQIPQQGKAEFPHNPQLFDAYTIGVWLGDGCRGTGNYTKDDIEIETEINTRGLGTKRYLPSVGKTSVTKVEGLREALRKHGLFHKYSYEKFIPEVYKTSGIQQRMDLLAGLMDTDGTVDKRDACTEYDTSSEQLAKDVQWLVRSLGGKTTITTKRSFLNGVEHRLCYRVRVTTDFNPFKLERKAQHWKKPTQNRYLHRTIKSIDLVGREEAMCITVACENHCYLTNDFIVTHNTFTLACLGWHFFITNHQPKIAALAITKDHLKANLWAELAKLHASSPLLKKSVEAGAERFSLKGHEMYSFIDARSFPKQADNTTMASALAGLHAPNIAFLLDEAGMIPDVVLVTADNALSGGESETMKKKIMAAGNPEVASGLIYRASIGQSKQRWGVLRVTGDPDDPKRSPRVDVNWAREQIATFGKDDPWVQVNVFGEYPKTAVNTLLSDSEVAEAMGRVIHERSLANSQTRLGIDVARGGVDRTAFAKRKGLKAWPIDLFPSTMYGPELAGIVALRQRDENIERVFVDNTGGYGSSVIDSLSLFPHIEVTPVIYNASAQEKTRYFNKRTEMWVRMRDWVKKGGQLPNDPMLAEELTTPRLIFHSGVTRLESKDDIKKRLGRSPDRADALAQTFSDVEQSSFFSDHSVQGIASDGRQKSYDEIVNEWQDKGKQQDSYMSGQSHLDKSYRPPSNHRS